MARGNRPRRTTHVPVTAIGSGARLTDLFPLPLWIFIPLKIAAWWVRHWWVTALILSAYFLPTIYFILILLSVPLFMFGVIALNNRHHHPRAWVTAALRLVRVRLSWTRACEAGELNDGPHRPRLTSFKRPAKIVNDRGTALEFTLNLSRVGLTVNDLEKGKDYVAATLNARRTRVHRLTPGIARFTIEWERKLQRSAVANPAHQINATQLPRIELDQDVLIELDTSILVVGESGSGKSNLTWDILNEMNDIPINYRLFVVDPKKVELADLLHSPYTVSYSDSPQTADATIEKFYDSMMATFEKMKGLGIRKIVLDEDQPLNILIIDELLLCKQAKQGIDTHLGEILSAGRAAGHIVIANSQLGQVDAISRLRDLFPQRVCMAVKSGDLTNAVLGPNAQARGARCTEITEKGVGYIFTDFTGSFQRFKPPYIEDVSMVARGEVYKPPTQDSIKERIARSRNAHRACYTYRLYDKFGVLLYVGIAFNPNKRIPQHVDKPFYNAIDHGKTVIKKYPNEPAAREAETEAIENEHPRYNLIHNH